ncbi:MAG: quinone oxidoreductase family protein [Gaiella sp.]
MRAAQVSELGALPGVAEVAEPQGDDVLEVVAAPLNPIDLAASRGILAAGHPPLPYVPGCETVARRADGALVWVFGGGLGVARDGGMAERVALGAANAIPIPAGADPALAGAMGIAGLAGWLPFAWRAPLAGGEDVLVLGATGAVGQVALQAARLLGAGRIVAAGRSRAGLARALELGADDVVDLASTDDLVAAFKSAFGGNGPSYVFDPLWGAPAAAAIEAAVPWARLVNLGQSAGPLSEIASAAVRFKSISILGHTNFAASTDELGAHYDRLVRHAMAGEVLLDVERVALDDVADAWRRQAQSPGRKLVVVP